MQTKTPVLALLVLAASSASAQLLSIAPTVAGSFTTIRSYPIGEGSSSTLGPTAGSLLSDGGNFVNTTSWGAEFSLAGVPAGARLESATLFARPKDGLSRHWLIGYAADGTFVRRSSSAFYSGVSLGTFPDRAAGDLLDVTGYVKARLAAGDRFLGVNVGHFGALTTWYGTDTADGPRLTLRYSVAPVPEPAAFLPLGLGALVLLRQRRTSAG